MKKDKKIIPLVVCECGYNNQPENIQKYGTCRRCGKVLDKKAKFDYEMICKLRLWRGKRHGENYIKRH
jgi:predicted Zn-ribbon and HTH transcriptional regulator